MEALPAENLAQVAHFLVATKKWYPYGLVNNKQLALRCASKTCRDAMRDGIALYSPPKQRSTIETIPTTPTGSGA